MNDMMISDLYHHIMPSDSVWGKKLCKNFRGEMWKNALIIQKTHWIMQKLQQLTKIDNKVF